MRAFCSRRRPSSLSLQYYFQITLHLIQPEIRGAARCALGGAGRHTRPRREAKLAGGAAQCVLEGGRRRALPLRNFRVATIRPVEAGGPSLFTGAPAFSQTAARAHALQGLQMAFFDNLRAPYADFSHPCTILGKKVPWRPFQGMPRCGSLAGIHSVFHGIVRVSRYSS